MFDRPPGAPQPPENSLIPAKDSDSVSPTTRRLRAGPQPAIKVDELAESEREKVQVLGRSQAGTKPRNHTTTTPFKPVYYLPKQETEAIDLFVNLNLHHLHNLNLGSDNTLKQLLSPGNYTRVLRAAGRIDVESYRFVVHESWDDGTDWLIKPDWYDDHPEQRHEPGPHVARVPPSASLYGLYRSFGERVTIADIEDTAVDGQPGNVLRYYLSVADYDCQPEETTEGPPLLRKLDVRT